MLIQQNSTTIADANIRPPSFKIFTSPMVKCMQIAPNIISEPKIAPRQAVF